MMLIRAYNMFKQSNNMPVSQYDQCYLFQLPVVFEPLYVWQGNTCDGAADHYGSVPDHDHVALRRLTLVYLWWL